MFINAIHFTNAYTEKKSYFSTILNPVISTCFNLIRLTSTFYCSLSIRPCETHKSASNRQLPRRPTLIYLINLLTQLVVTISGGLTDVLPNGFWRLKINALVELLRCLPGWSATTTPRAFGIPGWIGFTPLVAARENQKFC